MQHDEIRSFLRETDENRLGQLWSLADRTRREHVGDEVHLRGLVELSNQCARSCGYCGLRAGNRNLKRYRMTDDEILECADQAVAFGYGTVVLQAGETPSISADWITEIIRRITAETPLAITLSLGERDTDDLAAWRAAGADRYLLRFETSNRALYERIHPPKPGTKSDRIALLGILKEMGYEIGSGVMIGIPGQTYDDLATDIALFAELDLDMIGVGPYLAHPDTPLGRQKEGTDGKLGVSPNNQVPNDELMTYKTVALARLVRPRANIPSTTALATLNLSEGRELGLMRGANVVMPNLTPPQYRALYEIYPSKACIRETATACHGCMTKRIRNLGRQLGTGRGDSPNFTHRKNQPIIG